MKLILPEQVNGILRLGPSHVGIRPGMQEAEFLSTLEGAQSDVAFSSQSGVGYRLRERFDLDELVVGVVVAFSRGVLAFVRIFVASGAPSWGDWSEAEEMRNRHQLENVLAVEYGGDRTFAWGDVRATYDPRSGSASISIRYTSENPRTS